MIIKKLQNNLNPLGKNVYKIQIQKITLLCLIITYHRINKLIKYKINTLGHKILVD